MLDPSTLVPDTTSTRLRRAYGFDEVALVPGAITVDPAEVDLTTEVGGHRLEIPFIASAMDAVADADFAARMSGHGGLAFVNLEGLYTRYEATPFPPKASGTLSEARKKPAMATEQHQSVGRPSRARWRWSTRHNPRTSRR